MNSFATPKMLESASVSFAVRRSMDRRQLWMRFLMIRSRLAVLAVSAMLFAAPASAGCPAESLVINVGKAFTAASRSGSAGAFSSAASRFADTRGIALSALGPHRKKLSKDQEGEYIRLAQGYIGRFMSRHASRFNAAGLKVTSCSGGTVTAVASGGRKLIFRINGGRLQDLNVSSVWLAGQMRSTFVGYLNRNNGDINALMKFLRG
jgi:ABC-type transporter MlaC component